MLRKYLITFVSVFLPTLCLAGPGDWYHLKTSEFEIDGPNGYSSFRKAIEDFGGILKAYKPRKAKVKNRKFEPRGPAGVPRISFDAEPEVKGWFDPTLTVRGDIFKSNINCHQWKSALPHLEKIGIALDLDLSDSEAVVREQASILRLEFCYQKNHDDSLSISARAFMQEGNDYGRVAGPISVQFLRNQVDPLLKALKSVAEQKR
ncbi:MAG: hypothetical protein A3K03_01230 [Bdellovibrionales bacterium RIFOXYD1_FULL_44_7]|nr:MAG: hypothetical protein A3K03_01230 [Bdellovibrionales bacterium RIFOXYD1_FULL_44_7]